jgi:hypothetical protein
VHPSPVEQEGNPPSIGGEKMVSAARDDAGMPGLAEAPLTTDPGSVLPFLESVRG